MLAFSVKGTAWPVMFVVLDELNMYAPSECNSPTKQIQLDVAEGGRSLDVILIRAQPASTTHAAATRRHATAMRSISARVRASPILTRSLSRSGNGRAAHISRAPRVRPTLVRCK